MSSGPGFGRAERLAVAVLILGIFSCNGDDSPTAPGGGRVARALPIAFVPEASEDKSWIAATQMVLRLYGVQAADCQLVTARFDYETDDLDLCCREPESCYGSTSTSPKGVQNVLTHVGRISSQYKIGTLRLDAVKDEINAGRPVLAAVQNAFPARMILIYGYTTDGRVMIHDPHVGTVAVPIGYDFNYADPIHWNETVYAFGQ